MFFKKRVFLLIYVFLLLNCSENIQEKNVSNTIYQETFSSPYEVRPGYRSKTDFSPLIKDKKSGLEISVPKINKFKPNEIIDGIDTFIYIPVSISYKFSLAYESKFDNLTNHIVIVAVNTVSGESFSATLEDEGDDSEYRESDISHINENDLNNTFSTGYLTVNLIDYINLPQEEAVYNIHATIEKFQSSQVTTSLIIDKD